MFNIIESKDLNQLVLVGILENRLFILGRIVIFTDAFLPVMHNGRFIQRHRSSFIVFSKGEKLRSGMSDSLGEILIPKYCGMWLMQRGIGNV